MGEVASAQNIAGAIAYAKKLGADKETAAKRGEELEGQLPFQFMWPGRPLNKPSRDVGFAHGFFTTLPEDGVRNQPPPYYPSAALGGPPTSLHVELVLELLLLCWPDPQVPHVLGGGEVPEMDVVVGQRWDWLLLMVALLQQTSTEQKQQVLRERGPLLMQLLYQVLLEDKGVGASANLDGLVTESDDISWHSWFLMVTSDVNSQREFREKTQWAASVPMAVTMVLQSLLYESLPESWVRDPVTAQIGGVLTNTFGTCGTRGVDGCIAWVDG
jgi:hypothetical protein